MLHSFNLWDWSLGSHFFTLYVEATTQVGSEQVLISTRISQHYYRSNKLERHTIVIIPMRYNNIIIMS